MIDLVAAGVGAAIGYAVSKWGRRVSRTQVVDARIGKIGEVKEVAKAPAPPPRRVFREAARKFLPFSTMARTRGHRFDERRPYHGDVLGCVKCGATITFAGLADDGTWQTSPLLEECPHAGVRVVRT